MPLKIQKGFVVPATEDLPSQVLEHFSALGYRVVEQEADRWVFTRGLNLAGKYAWLWSFSIKPYPTTLTVTSEVLQDGNLNILCDWVVETRLSIPTAGDKRKLESEGLALESTLKAQA